MIAHSQLYILHKPDSAIIGEIWWMVWVPRCLYCCTDCTVGDIHSSRTKYEVQKEPEI